MVKNRLRLESAGNQLSDPSWQFKIGMQLAKKKTKQLSTMTTLGYVGASKSKVLAIIRHYQS